MDDQTQQKAVFYGASSRNYLVSMVITIDMKIALTTSVNFFFYKVKKCLFSAMEWFCLGDEAKVTRSFVYLFFNFPQKLPGNCALEG